MNTLKEIWAKISAGWRRIPEKSAALILDWMLVVASVILVVVIYIPRGIWAEENSSMNDTLHRMRVVSKAEEMFHTITSDWATDGEYLFQLMSQAHDTLIGDTTFVGNQTIIVYGQPRHVNIPVGLGYQMDTTFSAPRPVRIVILDTTYTIVLWDAELSSLDTIYLTGAASLLQFDDDPAYRGIADTAYGSHSEVDNDYTWNRYRLTVDLLSNPDE